MSNKNIYDQIYLVGNSASKLKKNNTINPLVVCVEMFVELHDLELRRWNLWKLKNDIESEGYKCVILADFLNSSDIDWIEIESLRIAKNWFLDNGNNDVTIFKGISLGKCIEYNLKARVIRLLKLTRCFQKLKEKYQDLKIISYLTPGSIEERVLKELRIDFEAVENNENNIVYKENFNDKLAKNSLKDFLIKAAIYIYYGISYIYKKKHKRGEPRIIVQIGQQSNLLLKTWLEQNNRIGSIVLWLQSFQRNKLLIRILRSGHSLTAKRRFKFDREKNNLILNYIRNFDNSLVFKDETIINIGHFIKEVIAVVFKEESLQIQIAATESQFELSHKDTSLLILNNDCLPAQRAWTLMANKAKIKTLVLQHGHLDYFQDQNHLTASNSAFWTQEVYDEFLKLGLKPNQMFITGAQIADIYSSDRHTYIQNKNKKTKVLIMTTGNPGVQAYMHETWVCDYIYNILKILDDNFSELDICIKLHPGEKAELYKKFLAYKISNEYEIIEKCNLSDLFDRVDIVISPPSTVVLEARASGKNIILIPIIWKEVRYSNLCELEGVHTLNSYEDLIISFYNVLNSNYDLTTCRKPLDSYLGPIDGKASYRTLKLINNLLSSDSSKNIIKS